MRGPLADLRPNGLSLAGGGHGPLGLSGMVRHGVPRLPPWAFESAPFGDFGEKVLVGGWFQGDGPGCRHVPGPLSLTVDSSQTAVPIVGKRQQS